MPSLGLYKADVQKDTHHRKAHRPVNCPFLDLVDLAKQSPWYLGDQTKAYLWHRLSGSRRLCFRWHPQRPWSMHAKWELPCPFRSLQSYLTKLSPLCHKEILLRSPTLPSTVMYISPESELEKTRAISASLAVSAALSRSQSSKLDTISIESGARALMPSKG